MYVQAFVFFNSTGMTEKFCMFLQINGRLSLNWSFFNEAISYSFYIIILNFIVLSTEIKCMCETNSQTNVFMHQLATLVSLLFGR
jgi:hypothetical protein